MNTILLVLATTSASFNLVCTGTDDREDKAPALGGYRPEAPTSKPFREIYRVDLVHQRWCSGECEATSALYSVSPDTITFQFEKWAPYTNAFVSRETGKYVRERYFGTVTSFQWGRCSRAPFTGFPRRRF